MKNKNWLLAVIAFLLACILVILLMTEFKSRPAANPESTVKAEEAQVSEPAPAVPVPTVAERPNPQGELQSFVRKNLQILLSAAQKGDTAVIKSIDANLADLISALGIQAKLKTVAEHNSGTIAELQAYIIDGQEFAVNSKILLSNLNEELDKELNLQIYPTGLIANNGTETLPIYAGNPLTAYRTCCDYLNTQIQAAVIAEQQRLAQVQQQQNLQEQLQIAQQSAIKAQIAAASAAQEAQAARDQAAASAQAAQNANNNNWGGGYYGGRRWGQTVIITPGWGCNIPSPCPPLKPLKPPKPPGIISGGGSGNSGNSSGSAGTLKPLSGSGSLLGGSRVGK